LYLLSQSRIANVEWLVCALGESFEIIIEEKLAQNLQDPNIWRGSDDEENA